MDLCGFSEMKVPGWGRWHLPLACSWHVRETGKGLWDLPLQDNEEQMFARVEELSGPHSVRSTAEVLLVFYISKKQEHKPHFYSSFFFLFLCLFFVYFFVLCFCCFFIMCSFRFCLVAFFVM